MKYIYKINGTKRKQRKPENNTARLYRIIYKEG